MICELRSDALSWRDGHQITGKHLWQFDSRLGRASREARKEADRLACVAWNQRMLGFQGPAQPSPALGDALNAGYRTSKSNASAATRIRPSRWTLLGAEDDADP